MGLYKVTFLGLTVAGPEEEARLLGGLQKKFHLSPERAESLLQRVPIVVKKGISKEEMEKYVGAFREFGGKVRVEEEPTAEEPDVFQEPKVSEEPKVFERPRVPEEPVVSEPPRPERRPYAGVMVTCPQCGFEQPETDECVKCGIIISKFKQYEEMARSYEGQVREISSEEVSPWESGEGFIPAFLKTTKEALFGPTRFFRKIGEGEGMWAPLIYGVIAGIIGYFGALFWQWLIITQFFPGPISGILSAIPLSIILIVIIVAMPFMVAFSIFVGTCIIHVCLMIVGGRKKSFQTTFRAVSYSWSGNLFGIIPFIGSSIGGIYALVLVIIGIREGHGISTGRSILAVLLPLIVICGLGILAAIFIPLFVRSFVPMGGVRA